MGITSVLWSLWAQTPNTQYKLGAGGSIQATQTCDGQPRRLRRKCRVQTNPCDSTPGWHQEDFLKGGRRETGGCSGVEDEAGQQKAETGMGRGMLKIRQCSLAHTDHREVDRDKGPKWL